MKFIDINGGQKMKYYIVLNDQNVITKKGEIYSLIKNELYTLNELKKLGLEKYTNLMKKENLKSSEIYWSFGVRLKIVRTK